MNGYTVNYINAGRLYITKCILAILKSFYRQPASLKQHSFINILDSTI